MRLRVALLASLVVVIAGTACGPREKAPPDAAPEAVAFVGDEKTLSTIGWHRLVRRCGVMGGNQHVAVRWPV